MRSAGIEDRNVTRGWRCARRMIRVVPRETVVTGLDHVVWHVGSVDECLEGLVERMGFPLLHQNTEPDGLRFADIDLGLLTARVVETECGQGTGEDEAQLMLAAFETSLPLERASEELARYGLRADEARRSVAPSPGGGFRFRVLRGVTQAVDAPLTSALILLRRDGSQRKQLQLLRAGFAESGAAQMGVLGAAWLSAETVDGEGEKRWTNLLGPAHRDGERMWSFPEGPGLRIAPGWQNRLSSITLECLDIGWVARQLAACGIRTFGCCRGLVVEPASVGGLALRFSERFSTYAHVA